MELLQLNLKMIISYDFIHNKFNSNNNFQINKLLNEITEYEIN